MNVGYMLLSTSMYELLKCDCGPALEDADVANVY